MCGIINLINIKGEGKWLISLTTIASNVAHVQILVLLALLPKAKTNTL